MRRRARVVAGRRAGERRGEALVEGLDRDVDDAPQRRDEAAVSSRLRAVLAAQRQRQPDDDALGAPRRDELGQAREPARLAARSTTQSGRASVPVGSETATPVRAGP